MPRGWWHGQAFNRASGLPSTVCLDSFGRPARPYLSQRSRHINAIRSQRCWGFWKPCRKRETSLRKWRQIMILAHIVSAVPCPLSELQLVFHGIHLLSAMNLLEMGLANGVRFSCIQSGLELVVHDIHPQSEITCARWDLRTRFTSLGSLGPLSHATSLAILHVMSAFVAGPRCSDQLRCFSTSEASLTLTKLLRHNNNLRRSLADHHHHHPTRPVSNSTNSLTSPCLCRCAVAVSLDLEFWTRSEANSF